jgi:hypothetical protein
MSHKRDCYVIMPFSATASSTAEQWTEIYEEVFRPAVLECGYTCDRARPGTGSLPRGIVESLRSSFLVLADITDRNANVFYELGIRHALSRRTIIVSQLGQSPPSDLGGYWHLQYGTSPRQVSAFKADMKRLTQAIEADPERSDNPVADYLEGEDISINRAVNLHNLKKLSALYTELSETELILDDCLGANGTPASRAASLLQTGCLDLLLQTLYIDPGPIRLGQLYEFRQDIQLIKNAMADPHRVRKARTAATALSGAVHELRTRLLKGQFEEPTSVSVMVWMPSEVTVGIGSEPFAVRACPHDAALRLSGERLAGSAAALLARDPTPRPVPPGPDTAESLGSDPKPE